MSTLTQARPAWGPRTAFSPELVVYFAIFMILVTVEFAHLRGGYRLFGVQDDVAVLTVIGGGLWQVLLQRVFGFGRSRLHRAAQAVVAFGAVIAAALHFDDARHEDTLMMVFIGVPALGLVAWQTRVAPAAQVVARLLGGLLAGVAVGYFVLLQLDLVEGLRPGRRAAEGWLGMTAFPAGLLGFWTLFAVPPQRALGRRLTALVGLGLGAAAVPMLTVRWMFSGSDRVAMVGGGLALSLAAMTALIPSLTLAGADRYFATAMAGFCTVATAMLAFDAVTHLGTIHRPSEIVWVAALVGLTFGHGSYGVDLAFDGRVRHDLPFAFLGAALASTFFLIS